MYINSRRRGSEHFREWERTQLVTAIENIIMITKKLRIGLFLILAVSSYHNINVTVSSIYANKPHQL